MSNFVETSIPWIGEVPTDWVIKPLFSVATENKTKNKERNENVLSLSYGRIIRRDLSKNFGLLPENFDGYQVVETGYIIIRSTDLQNDKKSLRVGLVKEYGVITSAYIGLSPSNSIHPEYLFYYLNMCDLKKVFYSLGGGLRQSLRFEEFKRFPVIVPSIEEQKLISHYLDKETDKIDLLVERIKKKIELLKEKRTSLINHYVTKGLDPNAEMKDSGIEWIGETPSHWDIVSTKRLFNTYFGGSWGDEPEDNQVDNIVKVVRVTEFDMNYLEVTKEIPTLRSLKLSKESPKLLKNGDLILEKSGGGEKTPVGRVVLYHNHNNERVVNSNFTNVCRPNIELVDPQFSVFLLSSLYSGGATVRNIKQTTGIQNLDLDGFMSEKVSLPPLNEQTEISSRIILSNNFIQNLIQKNLEKINLLTEYRQSLISSIVTGKVRVTEDMI